MFGRRRNGNTRDNDWVLPSLVHYYDINTGALQRNVAALAELPEREQPVALAVIGVAVAVHVDRLDDQTLVKAAVSLADDLYKHGCSLVVWDELTEQYVAAVWGTFFEEAAKRGLTVRYLVENTWPDGMQRPLLLFGELYAAAGLRYVCPHRLAAELPEAAGAQPTAEGLAPYLAEARFIASTTVDLLVQRDLSFMYLEADDDGSFASMRELPQGPGVITMIRTEAGVPGSRIEAHATPVA